MNSYNDLNKAINEAMEVDEATKYCDDAAKECYNMDDKMAELAQKAFDNRDTEVGYDAYWELWKYQEDNKLPEDVFYDLSADFAWDSRLDTEMLKRAKAEGREDLINNEGEYKKDLAAYDVTEE